MAQESESHTPGQHGRSATPVPTGRVRNSATAASAGRRPRPCRPRRRPSDRCRPTDRCRPSGPSRPPPADHQSDAGGPTQRV
ncbi:MAG: hypothetical protein F9B45_29785 [Phycisphaera sp. RhM]|nr:hypothetical protein [Phycisphaera sp. RhM]